MNFRMTGCRACAQATSGDCGGHGGLPVVYPYQPVDNGGGSVSTEPRAGGDAIPKIDLSGGLTRCREALAKAAVPLEVLAAAEPLNFSAIPGWDGIPSAVVVSAAVQAAIADAVVAIRATLFAGTEGASPEAHDESNAPGRATLSGATPPHGSSRADRGGPADAEIVAEMVPCPECGERREYCSCTLPARAAALVGDWLHECAEDDCDDDHAELVKRIAAFAAREARHRAAAPEVVSTDATRNMNATDGEGAHG